MKNRFIKQLLVWLIVLIVLIGGIIGYKHFFSNNTNVSDNKYKIATAKKMNMQVKVQGKGSVYADSSKDIITNNNGTLKNLKVKIGDTVTVGDNLFIVDNNELRQNVLKAQNNLERQKLILAGAKNDNEVAVNSVAVKEAENQLNIANEQVNKMTVLSPVSGTVVAKSSNDGDIVQMGKPIVTIVDTASMKIKVSVDELNITKVKIGQQVQIKFNALNDKNYEGIVDTVAQVGTTVNNITTYEVIVSIKDSTDIKIGMNANVNILVDNKDEALVIPKEALIEKEGKRYAMTSSSDENENLVPVTTGSADGDYVEILDGVQDGEEVLISLPSNNSSSGLSSEDVINKIKRFGGGH